MLLLIKKVSRSGPQAAEGATSSRFAPSPSHAPEGAHTVTVSPGVEEERLCWGSPPRGAYPSVEAGEGLSRPSREGRRASLDSPSPTSGRTGG